MTTALINLSCEVMCKRFFVSKNEFFLPQNEFPHDKASIFYLPNVIVTWNIEQTQGVQRHSFVTTALFNLSCEVCASVYLVRS